MKTPYLLVLVISSMLPAAGCGSSAQESVTATLEPDAGQPEPGQPHAGQPPASTYAVRGTATGILEPVAVRLDVNGQSDSVIIEADGPFAFTIALADGDAYAVSVASASRCALASERGTVAGADPEVVIGCEGLVMLTDLHVMGPSAPEHLELSPMLLDYEAEISLLQQAAVLVATAASAEASMTIAGMPADSGAPSEPIPLALGVNQIAIQVTHPLGLEREYRIAVSRALDIDQYAYGKASNTQAGDWFGYTMAISGDTLAIGAPSDDSAATGVDGDQSDNSASASGAVYIFRRTGSVWAQEAYLKASNTEAGDRFGVVVALDGDVVAVGARHEDSAATTTDGDQANNMAQDSGAVYVFRRTGSVWAQEAYLKAFNSNSGDQFGHSLALAGDVLAVGARREDSAANGGGGNQNDNSAMDSGAVYVYRRTPASWTHEAYLKASNTGAMDHFGESMALSGNTLAVGAYGEDSAATSVDGDQSDNSAEMSGAVYVFTGMGGTWRQQAYLKASNSDPGDTFGSSVALAGNTLAVGAYGESSAATGVDGDEADNGAPETGAVYIFRRTAGEWAQAAYIKASNAQSGDWFGSSVALWGDTLAVGAVFEAGSSSGIHGDADDNGAPFSGAAYLFRRSGSSWSQTDYIKASNPGINDQFGWRVALGEDGLAVSALYESSDATGIDDNQSNNTALGSGAVYIFH